MEQLGFFTVLEVPVIHIFVYLFTPLGWSHSDHFAMVHVHYLLVDVNLNEVVVEGSGLTGGAGVGAGMWDLAASIGLWNSFILLG